MDEKEKQKIIYDGAIKILNTIIAKEGVSYLRKQEQIEDAIEYAEKLYDNCFPNSN